MAFDVASVKQDKSGLSGHKPTSNVPLDPEDLSASTGGLLSATNFSLLQFMMFAYKLTPWQTSALQTQVPWANTDRYDIQARASGNPTKDQLRLMMQALLVERFKLMIHFETQQLPVFAMVLDKPGKLGPKLQPHSDDASCSNTLLPLISSGGPQPTVAGGFPEMCGAILVVQPSAPGLVRAGGRDMPMAMIAMSFSFPVTGIDRPIVDKTGLAGKFDFVIEFTPELSRPSQPGVPQPDDTGPTFLEALKEQLGLKLDKQTGSVDSIVVDHIEQPSEN